MGRSRSQTLIVATLGGLAAALLFCALGTLVYLVVARLLANPSPFATYTDLLWFALVFSGPCALPAWAALVHISIVDPRGMRRSIIGRGAIHGMACVVVPCLLMPLLVKGGLGVGLILGLLATSAGVGMLVAPFCARLATWSGLVDTGAQSARRTDRETKAQESA